ncbi:hypothetical protein ACKWTF_000594 [Chironomus riparius]
MINKTFLIFELFILITATCACSKTYCSSGIVRDSTFIELGYFGGKDKCGNYYQKLYYYPRYLITTWMEARSFCKSYDMALATFRTLEEALSAINMVEKNIDLGTRDNLWVFIDGTTLTPRSPTDWYWTDTGDKIDFLMPWLPTQPDTNSYREFFLSIGRHKKTQRVGFNDIPGTNFYNTFLCQKYV